MTERKHVRTGKPVGRPPGKEFSERKTFTFRPVDEARVRVLAARGSISESEVVRNALEAAVRAAGVTEAEVTAMAAKRAVSPSGDSS